MKEDLTSVGISDEEEIVPPRPVFHEELDLLGFDNYWNYEKSKAPLLWSVGRRYYYKGEWVAEARGGNIYEKPEIILYRGIFKTQSYEKQNAPEYNLSYGIVMLQLRL